MRLELLVVVIKEENEESIFKDDHIINLITKSSEDLILNFNFLFIKLLAN